MRVFGFIHCKNLNNYFWLNICTNLNNFSNCKLNFYQVFSIRKEFSECVTDRSEWRRVLNRCVWRGPEELHRSWQSLSDCHRPGLGGKPDTNSVVAANQRKLSGSAADTDLGVHLWPNVSYVLFAAPSHVQVLILLYPCGRVQISVRLSCRCPTRHCVSVSTSVSIYILSLHKLDI